MDLPNVANVVIGLPFCGRPVAPEWVLQLLTQSYPMNTKAKICAVSRQRVDDGRNLVVEEALKEKAKYVWFVDDDTAPPSDALRALMYELKKRESDGVMAMGGVYCIKRTPSEPLLFRNWEQGDGVFWDWRVGEIFDVDAIGTGCLLINTEVFHHLKKPYFNLVDEGTTDKLSYSVKYTDDIYFCKKVRDAGFRIMAHGGVLCTHWELEPRMGYNLPIDSKPWQTYNGKDMVLQTQAYDPIHIAE